MANKHAAIVNNDFKQFCVCELICEGMNKCAQCYLLFENWWSFLRIASSEIWVHWKSVKVWSHFFVFSFESGLRHRRCHANMYQDLLFISTLCWCLFSVVKLLGKKPYSSNLRAFVAVATDPLSMTSKLMQKFWLGFFSATSLSPSLYLFRFSV